MNRYRNAREAELSLLAQGRGLVDGGVELECFADDRRSFTLNGQAFIKPSQSSEGQHVKPYKRFELALPKTYITRRGQMVLFTSPEDMIVGQSVTLQHRQEVTSATAAQRLRTVNTLVSSSLDYEPAKSKSSEVGEFTPVYLQRLREAAERAKEAENYQAQSLEKDENMEEDDLEAADSGMGASLRPTSSGRLSSLSHYSDGTIIQIPGGRLTEEREEELVSPTDPLKLLAGDLAGHMPSAQKPKTKSKSTKKRKSTLEPKTSQKQKSSKAKGKKRKRGKKNESTDGGVASRGSSKVNGNTLSDLESKRREKRELERQREEEARERARLESELRKLREAKSRMDGGEGSEIFSEGRSTESGDGRRECVAMAKGGTRVEQEQDTCHRKKRDGSEGTKPTDQEKAERARQAYEKGAKLREKSNYNNHLELQSLRLSQSITPSYTFSYFQYVPSQGAEKSGGGTAKGGRRGQQTKRQRPPKK